MVQVSSVRPVRFKGVDHHELYAKVSAIEDAGKASAQIGVQLAFTWLSQKAKRILEKLETG